MKIRFEKGKIINKWILRKVLNNYIPPELFDRPKKGFSIPIGQWIRGSLKEWAGDMLSPENIRKLGILDEKYVTNLFNEHINQKADNTEKLWTLLMWQQWLEKWHRN